MNKYLIKLLTISLILFNFGCGNGIPGIKETHPDYRKEQTQTQEQKFREWLPVELPDMHPFHVYKTPKGAPVSTQDPIPEDIKQLQFKAIDDGIDRAFASSADKGYTDYRAHDQINIVLIRPNYTSEIDDAGLIKIKEQYGGFSVCGITIGTESNPFVASPFIVQAQNFDSKYLTLLRNCTRHETEHLQTLNDPDLYRATTGANDKHPIFPMAGDEDWYVSPVQ